MKTAELIPLLFCCFAFLAFLVAVLLVLFGSRLKAGALNVSLKAGGVEVNAAGGAFGVLAVVFGVLTWLTLPGQSAFPEDMLAAETEGEHLARSKDPERSKKAREILGELRKQDRIAAKHEDPAKRLGAVFRMQQLRAELKELQGKSDEARALRDKAAANADWLARARPEEVSALVQSSLGKGGLRLGEVTARSPGKPRPERPDAGEKAGPGEPESRRGSKRRKKSP